MAKPPDPPSPPPRPASHPDAVDLAYTWRVGDEHRFRYRDATTFAVGGPHQALAPPLRLGTETVFAEQVERVSADGSAVLTLTVESLALCVEGNRIATLHDLPDHVRRLEATVDRKGNLTLARRVTAWSAQGTVYLATGTEALDDGPTPAGDGEAWRVFATVDATTGHVTPTPGPEPPRIPADALSVEALPLDLFDLLVLPDGGLDAGDTLSLSVPGIQVETTLTRVTGGIADLSLRIGTTVQAALAEAPGLGPLPDLDLLADPDPPPPASEPPPEAPVLDGGLSTGSGTRADFTFRFDAEAGQLVEAGGVFSMTASLDGLAGLVVESHMVIERL